MTWTENSSSLIADGIKQVSIIKISIDGGATYYASAYLITFTIFFMVWRQLLQHHRHQENSGISQVFQLSLVVTRLEAPDGGWGILVCIGMAISFISGFGSMPSFGLVFADFLNSIGAETSAIAFIISAFFSAFSFAGLFSGSLFKRFSVRTVGLIGGSLYFTGSFLQIFVTSVTGLVFSFSLIQGAGFGLIVPTSYTTFNNYFVKKRVMWMSFAQSLIGVGTMLYPVLMHKLLEWYGFRGCLLVLAAINAHAILGMLLMHPVEWHMRFVPITDQKLNELQAVQLPTAVTNGNAAEDSHHLSPLMYSRHSSLKLSKEEIAILKSRTSSIISLGNWTGPVVVSDASPEMMHVPTSRRQSVISSIRGPTELKKTKWKMLVDFLDLTLLKQPIYVNIVLGISFALYSDIAFYTLQPLYLFELEFDKPATANIIAIGAAADLISRIFLAFAAVFIQMPSRYIYLAGSFFTVLSRFAFLHVFDFESMVIIAAVMGFLRSWIHVPLPLVFAEYLPKERFASGYGLFMFLQGNIMFIIGPVVGYLRDRTQDYALTFHCLNLFMALCTVPWLVEIICLKFKRKGKIGGNSTEPANKTIIVQQTDI